VPRRSPGEIAAAVFAMLDDGATLRQIGRALPIEPRVVDELFDAWLYDDVHERAAQRRRADLTRIALSQIQDRASTATIDRDHRPRLPTATTDRDHRPRPPTATR
jgi:hypothetical protein